jgi:hypothetical protein
VVPELLALEKMCIRDDPGWLPIPSSVPARLRPAGPPAFRPNSPGRLAWTRQLPGGAAQRLHTNKPSHVVSHSTLHKYHLKEKANKKTLILEATFFSQRPVTRLEPYVDSTLVTVLCLFTTSQKEKSFLECVGLRVSVQMKPFTVADLLRDYFRGMSG